MDIRRLYPLFILLAVAHPQGGCGHDSNEADEHDDSGASDSSRCGGCGGCGDDPAPDDTIPTETDDTSKMDDSGDPDDSTVDQDQDQDEFTPREGDCDDNNPAVYPYAPEICDGFDNDCNDDVDEAQIACYTTKSGTFDFATKLNEATMENPVTIVLDLDGRLELGEGKWYASLDLRANITIEGAGTDKTVLLGASTITPLVIADNDTNGYVIDIQDMTFANGAATQDVLGRLVGGAAVCISTVNPDESAGTARTSVTLSYVTLRDSAAVRGGGLYTGGCEFSFSNVIVSGNDARSGWGGGIFTESDSRVYMLDSQIINNSALVGGNLLINSDVTCELVNDVNAGVRGGKATSAGGGAYLSTGSINSIACDWGSGDDDNTVNGLPQDIEIDGFPSYNVEGSFFYCDASTGCIASD